MSANPILQLLLLRNAQRPVSNVLYSFERFMIAFITDIFPGAHQHSRNVCLEFTRVTMMQSVTGKVQPIHPNNATKGRQSTFPYLSENSIGVGAACRILTEQKCMMLMAAVYLWTHVRLLRHRVFTSQ